MRAPRSVRNWVMLAWAVWMLGLFGSYFYHMVTLPERWDKIVDLLQRLAP